MSSTPFQTPESQPSKPGKIRTWWHPLLANLLRWQLGSHYHLEDPLLTLVSPTFLKQGLATYQRLRQGGYTDLVVYLWQQARQFQLRGEEFAMQHLGAEGELKQVWRAMLADMCPKERLEGLSAEEVLQGLTADKGADEELKQVWRTILADMSPKERLEGLSPKELLEELSPKKFLEGLTAAQREQLRQMLEQSRPANGSKTS